MVGACGDDVGGNRDQGSAYVFARSGTTWSQQAKLTAADGAAGDQFGHSGRGLRRHAPWSGRPATTSAATPTRARPTSSCAAAATWSQQQKLTAADGAANDYFGEGAVALDGESALVGAPSDDVGSNIEQGSATVFRR